MASKYDSKSDLSLPSCRHSYNCYEQFDKQNADKHNQTYSHPCRFSELCKNKDEKTHSLQFTHFPHQVPQCRYDGKCNALMNPAHRYAYRHRGLPDLLVPCRFRNKCRLTDDEHRKKFSHGERVDNTENSEFHKNKTKLSRSSVHANENAQNEVDSIFKYYNKTAGQSIIPDAPDYDKYGNAAGNNYDLGQDGAFHEYRILIAQFYQDAQFNDEAIQIPINALTVKGFQVKLVKTENECIQELESKQYHVAWIISTLSIQNSAFTPNLKKFHESGGAIFLFADNVPYICHAQEFLQQKFGITLTGEYYGAKTLTFLNDGHSQTGHFGQHEIFSGIQNLYEGITICHPIYPTEESRKQLVNLATASDGNPLISVHDPPIGYQAGRLALDCGFTKLYINWDSAGSARYIVNVTCWLLGIEKRINTNQQKNRKK